MQDRFYMPPIPLQVQYRWSIGGASRVKQGLAVIGGVVADEKNVMLLL